MNFNGDFNNISYLFYCVVPDNSSSFSRVVDDMGEGDSLSLILFLAVVLFLIVIVLMNRRGMHKLVEKRLFFSSDKQSERLVEAFGSLENAIKDRDVNLRKDYENIKVISDNKTGILVDVSHEMRSPMHAILNFAEIDLSRF